MTNTAFQYLFISLPKAKAFVLYLLVGLMLPFNGLAHSKSNDLPNDPKLGVVSHFLWLDFDKNGSYDFGEQILKNLEVKLFEAKTDSLLSSHHIIDEGRFFFKELPKGEYYLSITFLDEKKSNEFQPVIKDQVVLADQGLTFKTKPFILDPSLEVRRNINIPFQLPDLASSIITCTDFIDSSSIALTIENCDNMAQICLEETIGSMMSYSISDNGQTYTGGLSPCDFDTSFAYTYSNLPDGGLIGPYHVDSWLVDGVSYSGAVANMSDLSDSMNLWNSGGNWIYDNLTASIRGGSTGFVYGDINITQIATNLSGNMSITTTLNPNGTQLSLDTGYHQIIFTEPIEGCTDTLEVQIDCIPCPVLFSGMPSLDVDNCNDEQAFCFDLSPAEFLMYTISDNGVAYNGTTNICSTDSFFRYDYSGLPGGGTLGPYILQSWTVNNTTYLGGFNAIGDLVDSMNVWDAGGNWEISDPLQTISGGQSNNSYSDIAVLQIVTNNSGAALVEQIASVNSMEIMLDTGYHEIVFFDPSNQCQDTFDLEVNCAPCISIFNGINITETAVDCDSSVAVCLPVPFAEINDYTLILNGLPYTDAFVSCDTINTEIELDTGTYQLILTHNVSACTDSIMITIGCTPVINCSDFINETFVAIQLETCDASGELCVEIPFAEISDYLVTDNQMPFNMLSACSAETMLTLESGLHEIVFEHQLTGCKDTITSLVACMIPETINSSILVMESDTICLDASELPGTIVSVTNICELNSGELALVELDTASLCVHVEGIEQGTEEVCMVVCDNYGFCDTTFINIEVDTLPVENQLLPVAHDDDVVTLQGGSVNVVVFENDELNGVLDSFGILTQPNHGLAFFENDFTIKYIPDSEFCTSSNPDSLTYYFCNEIGCDTASVYIEVTCGNLKVYNGFSPNGDGQNDYFVIRNAHTDTEDKLAVFNRWGIRVLYQEDYQNDWNGTWNGLDLPDGTYFYYYTDGQERAASGYVLIQR